MYGSPSCPSLLRKNFYKQFGKLHHFLQILISCIQMSYLNLVSTATWSIKLCEQPQCGQENTNVKRASTTYLSIPTYLPSTSHSCSFYRDFPVCVSLIQLALAKVSRSLYLYSTSWKFFPQIMHRAPYFNGGHCYTSFFQIMFMTVF